MDFMLSPTRRRLLRRHSAFESDGTDKASLSFEKIIDGMKCHTPDEIEKALKSAGFSKVRTDHHESKPWITVLAEK